MLFREFFRKIFKIPAFRPKAIILSEHTASSTLKTNVRSFAGDTPLSYFRADFRNTTCSFQYTLFGTLTHFQFPHVLAAYICVRTNRFRKKDPSRFRGMQTRALRSTFGADMGDEIFTTCQKEHGHRRKCFHNKRRLHVVIRSSRPSFSFREYDATYDLRGRPLSSRQKSSAIAPRT